MLCEDVMKRAVHCCGPEDSIELAARKMRDRNIGFLPICDGKMHAIGVLTDRDIAIRVVAAGRPPSTLCGDVMSREIIACSPSDTLLYAEHLMSEHRKSRIMCVDRAGCLVGIISLSDIAHLDSDRQVAQTMRDVTDRESFTIH